jgi:hypothetical protein
MSDKADAFERERLGLLCQALDPLTQGRLDRLGVQPGWSCLEVGAGAGSVARALAARAGPGGRVVATDVDTRFLLGQALAVVPDARLRLRLGEALAEQGRWAEAAGAFEAALKDAPGAAGPVATPPGR